MSLKLYSQCVNIYAYPKIIYHLEENPGLQITIGDLHGNAIKLLYLLIEQGLIQNLGYEAFETCVRIYRMDKEALTKTDLKTFKRIINAMTCAYPIKIRLIGDELADRGSNDYFTFVILDKIRQLNISLEILISNHGLEFIQAFELGGVFTNATLNPLCTTSMENLQFLFDKGLVHRQEVQHFYDKSYKPFLKMVSCVHDKIHRSMTLFSHAAIGLNNLENLALRMGVPYFDESAQALKKTIVHINLAFKAYLDSNKVHTLFSYTGVSQVTKEYSIRVSNAVEFVTWNRDHYNLERPAIHPRGKYLIHYVHGHEWTLAPGNPKHVFNLDNFLGKDDKVNIHFSYLLYGGLRPEFMIYPKRLDLLKAQLKLIKNKANQFKLNKDEKSYALFFELYQNLKNLLGQLHHELIDLVEFKSKAFDKIEQTQIQMSKEPLWTDIFSQTSSLVNELGLRCFTAGLMSKMITGKFLIFQKQSIGFMHSLKQEVDKETAPFFSKTLSI